MGAKVRVEVNTPFGDTPIVFECGTLGELNRTGAIAQLVTEETIGAGMAIKSNHVGAVKNFAVRVVRRVSGIEPAPDLGQKGEPDKAGNITGSWADEFYFPALEMLAQQLRQAWSPAKPVLEDAVKNG